MPDDDAPTKNGRRRWRALVRTVLGAGVVAVGLLGLVWALQRSLIYFPDSTAAGPAADALPGAEDVTHHTADGLELDAWFLPADADPDPEAGTGGDAQAVPDMAVLYLPGNAGNRAGRVPVATALAERGFAVMLVDYRGFGGNPDRPSEDGLAADARSAQQALADRGYGPERTIYVGESLGSGVAARLAAEVPPAGLLLRSPMTNLADVGRAHYPFLPVGTLLREDYDVVGHLGQVQVPVAVMYSEADEVVPAEQSAQVAAGEQVVETLVLDGAGHNDPVMFGDPLVDLTARLAASVPHDSQE